MISQYYEKTAVITKQEELLDKSLGNWRIGRHVYVSKGYLAKDRQTYFNSRIKQRIKHEVLF